MSRASAICHSTQGGRLPGADEAPGQLWLFRRSLPVRQGLVEAPLGEGTPPGPELVGVTSQERSPEIAFPSG